MRTLTKCYLSSGSSLFAKVFRVKRVNWVTRLCVFACLQAVKKTVDHDLEFSQSRSILFSKQNIWAMMRLKPVLGVSDKARLKHISSATKTKRKILLEANLVIILSKKGITTALIIVHGCTGWSAPLLFTNTEDRFSHVEAHIMFSIVSVIKCSLSYLLNATIKV